MNPIEYLKSLINETTSKLKAFAAFILLLAFMLLVFSAQAGNVTTIINGNFLGTNNNVALYSNTNTLGSITNNYQNGTVPGASNVLYFLSINNGSLPPITTTNALGSIGGTNAWPPVLPAASFSPQGLYPNTLYGPYNNFVLGGYCTLMATNATSTAIIAIFAGSIDGIYWQTNVLVLPLTVPINSFSPTNFITINTTSGGWSYYALQQVNNPGVAALTNLVLEANGKPGL